MKKEYQSSVRYSNLVKGILEKQPGKGFNQKLENLVLDYHFSENKRQENIKRLDDEIKKKEKEYNTLVKKINLMKSLESSLDSIKRLITDSNKVVQEILTFSPP